MSADILHDILASYARAPEIVNAATLTEPGDSLTTDEQNRLEMMMEERAMSEAHEGADIFLEWVAENPRVVSDYCSFRRATCDPQEWADLQEGLF